MKADQPAQTPQPIPGPSTVAEMTAVRAQHLHLFTGNFIQKLYYDVFITIVSVVVVNIFFTDFFELNTFIRVFKRVFFCWLKILELFYLSSHILPPPLSFASSLSLSWTHTPKTSFSIKFPFFWSVHSDRAIDQLACYGIANVRTIAKNVRPFRNLFTQVASVTDFLLSQCASFFFFPIQFSLFSHSYCSSLF